MTSDPDFELLAKPAGGPRQRWLLLGSAVLAVSAATWAATLWAEQRKLEQELARLASAGVRTSAPATAPEPPYAAAAWKAAELLQAPVDAWLRELEHCQPDQARTRDLRIDAASRRVSSNVEVLGDVTLSTWLQCFNAGLEPPVWRVVQVDAGVDGIGGTHPTWTVVLERSGK